jgi:hypothetical protein
MNHVSQTQNLSEILKNILSEIQENNVIKNNHEERLNKILKAFSYIDRQMNKYVSNFAFDENSKNIL